MKKACLLLAVLLAALTALSVPSFAEEDLSAKWAGKTIQFVHPASSQIELDWCDMFKKDAMEKYGVNVEFMHISGQEVIQKITIMTAANDWPDIIAAQDVTDYSTAGILEPITPFIENDPSFDASVFNPGGVQFATVDGVTYYMPSTVIPYAMLVNTKVCEQCGVDWENLKTWDDLYAACKTITDQGIQAYAFCGSANRLLFRDFYVRAASNGVLYSTMAQEGMRDKLIHVIESYKEMAPYIIENWDSVAWPDMHRYIIDSNTAFLATGAYYSGMLGGMDDMCLEYLRPIPYPTGPDAESTMSLIGGFGYAIFTGSEDKDLAWQLVKDCYQSKFAALLGSQNVPALPVDQDILSRYTAKYYPNTLDSQLEIVGRWNKIMADTGIAQPIVVGQTELEATYAENFYEYIDGNITSEEFADALIEKSMELNG